ncbi:hypothetical protein [Chryseolinea sp. T2]|uniref:hypothetical protein n=1 Tax=Chryseolinea sp. T2 TaxID=3129255 RepID=UPI0030779807
MAAIGLSLIMTVAVLLMGSRGPWGSFWTLFVVLFLALWVTGLYVTPIGPVYWGVAWMPMILAGIILAILLIIGIPKLATIRRIRNGRLRNKSREAYSNDNEEKRTIATRITLGAFFWILVLLLSVAIVVGL